MIYIIYFENPNYCYLDFWMLCYIWMLREIMMGCLGWIKLLLGIFKEGLKLVMWINYLGTKKHIQKLSYSNLLTL